MRLPKSASIRPPGDLSCGKCTYFCAKPNIGNISALFLAGCANLHPSFETDWFLRRSRIVDADLNPAANSTVN
jgi:hypothetical protein